MAYSPHAQSNGSKEPSGGKKPAGGFFVFVKKLARLLRQTKKTVVTLRVKRDISKLEHERSKERTDLLSQRRFYERFLRRNSNAPVVAEENIKPKMVVNEEPIKKNNTAFETMATKVNQIQELPAMPKPEIKSFQEMPTYQIPNSQDIQPMMKSVETEISDELSLNNKVDSVTQSKSVELPVDNLAKTENKLVASNTSNNLKFFKKLFNFLPFGSLVKKLAEERQDEEAIKDRNEVEGRFFQPYNGVKANLIKDQGVLFFNWQQKMLTLSLSIILCCLAISLSYVGLLIWQKERLNDNKATLANFDVINIEVIKNEDELKEITDFNKKLDVVSFILSNHVYWTNFLSFLENNTLKDVYYENFSGDLTGKYKIASVARNLNAISLQLEVMKAYNMIKTIQYSSAQADTEEKTPPAVTEGPTTGTSAEPAAKTIKFNLEMSLDPKIFIK